MTSKNVRIKDMAGNVILPKTQASLVKNNSNEDLGDVQANAQVNTIEVIKVNNTSLVIEGKAVDITLEADSEYSISSGTSTYSLTKDGEPVGTTITIPADMFLTSASLEQCETADQPVEGLAVGDYYLDLVIANSQGSHVYVPVEVLSDKYTQGTGVLINGQKEVSINFNVVAEKATSLSGYGITDSMTKTQMDTAFGNITWEEITEHPPNTIVVLSCDTTLPSQDVEDGDLAILSNANKTTGTVKVYSNGSWVDSAEDYSNNIFWAEATEDYWCIVGTTLYSVEITKAEPIEFTDLPTTGIENNSYAYVRLNGQIGWVVYNNNAWGTTLLDDQPTTGTWVTTLDTRSGYTWAS